HAAVQPDGTGGLGHAVLLLVSTCLRAGGLLRHHRRLSTHEREAGPVTRQQTEITVFAVLLIGMLVLAFFASSWRRPVNPHSLEECGVGGRAFGNWVTWFLIGGSSYTAYTFVAVPALVYGVGAIGFYAIPFALITTPLVYLISVRIWSVSHAHGFVTSA